MTLHWIYDSNIIIWLYNIYILKVLGDKFKPFAILKLEYRLNECHFGTNSFRIWLRNPTVPGRDENVSLITGRGQRSLENTAL